MFTRKPTHVQTIMCVYIYMIFVRVLFETLTCLKFRLNLLIDICLSLFVFQTMDNIRFFR